MSDPDGSLQRDDRHHRRFCSRSPFSPGYAGETLAEREEWRLAEAAVPVGPPARQSRAASADTGSSTPGPAPARETAPAAQAASPAALPPEGAPGAQGAETPAQQAALRPRPRPPARRQPRPRPPDWSIRRGTSSRGCHPRNGATEDKWQPNAPDWIVRGGPSSRHRRPPDWSIQGPAAVDAPRTRSSGAEQATGATGSHSSGHEDEAEELQQSRVEDEAGEKRRRQDEDKAKVPQ